MNKTLLLTLEDMQDIIACETKTLQTYYYRKRKQPDKNWQVFIDGSRAQIAYAKRRVRELLNGKTH
jgi:hypothetical protein